MKQKVSNLLSIVLPLGLGLGLTIYFYNTFTQQQKDQMFGYFINANYNFVLLSFVFAFLGYVFRAYRWKYTLEQIGCKPSFSLNFIAVSIGYFVNLTVPRAGEVSRGLIIKKYQNQPFDKVFGTIIAERIVDFAILLIFIIIALIIEFDTLRDFLLLYIPIKKLLWLIGISVVIAIILGYLYFFSKLKLVLLIKTKVQGLKEGAFSVAKNPHKWEFIFYTLLIWISYVMMFYSSTFALEQTSNITIGTILVTFVIGSLTIAFTNGGFGFFPVLIANILLLYGVPKEAGTAFGWIIWISQLLITVILGIFSFAVLPWMVKKINVLK